MKHRTLRRLRIAALTLLVTAGVTTASATDPPTWPDLSAPLALVGGGEHDAVLIVGVEDYWQLSDVNGAAANAKAWYRYVTHTRGVPPSRVRALYNEEATVEILRDEIDRKAQQVGPDGTLWFVFIGHGAPSEDGTDGILIGADAQRSVASVYDRSLRRGELLSRLGQGSQQHTVVVLDACFSGQNRSGEDLVEDLQAYVPNRAAALPANATVLSAAGANQFAGALPGLGRPAFSYLLLGAMRGWGDRDVDGVVTAREAVDYAREAIEATVKDRTQTPDLSGSVERLALAHHGGESGPDLAALAEAYTMPSGRGGVGGGQIERGVMLDRGEDIVNERRDETGFLLVRVEPAEATIVINGEEVGQGAVQLEKMVGQYVVVGELGALYHPARQEVELSPDGARLALTLAPAWGSRAVTSEPSGAEVWVAGEQVGVTPWQVERKPSGTYDVRVALSEYLSDNTSVTVSDQQTAKHHVALTPNFGTLTVASDPPGAAIALNGADTGAVTPSTFERVTAGIAEVRLSLAGYGEWVERPTVERSGAVRLDASLEAKLGALTVLATDADGSPCEADVEVAGRSVGRTPLKVELPAREHEVTVRYGNKTLNQTASVVHNDKVMLQFEFVPGAGLDGMVISEHGYEMVAIEAGEFWMGSSEDEEGHLVRLTQAFAIGSTEVTQALYESVMGENPSHFEGADRPVEEVSWCDAVLFCNRLSELEGLEAAYRLPRGFEPGMDSFECEDMSPKVKQKASSDGYRLPTEAEWEYAARGGEAYEYSGSDDVAAVAWNSANSDKMTHDVGGKQANGWGLSDMSGNVWEWVWDWYGSYPSGTVTDPVGAKKGSYRVIRGGSWLVNPRIARVANRSYYDPGSRVNYLGLRLARSL